MVRDRLPHTSSRLGPQPRREKQTLRLWPGAALSWPLTSWTVSCSGYRSTSSQMAGTRLASSAQPLGPPAPCSPTRLADNGALPLPIPGLSEQGGGPRAEGRGRPGKVALHGSGCRAHHIRNIPTEAGRAAPAREPASSEG